MEPHTIRILATTPSGLIDDLRPAVPPAEIDLTWLLMLGLGLLLLICILWAVRARIQKTVTRLITPRPEDPAKAAHKSLRDLRREQSALATRDFLQKLSDILRVYLEARTEFSVTCQTTGEFLKQAHEHSILPADCLEGIEDFLQTCDRSKFAQTAIDAAQKPDLTDRVEQWIRSIESARAEAQKGATS